MLLVIIYFGCVSRFNDNINNYLKIIYLSVNAHDKECIHFVPVLLLWGSCHFTNFI